ncbi:exosortase Q [Pseudorhodoferax sp. Leaf267]|uniref:exosortase Q n=1 Tax=Pseudorhodoferax sp. Leaf267 TaxID=1736316 RepID=UPI0006FE5AF0|nr:exosortase Q [Pseudorhodoferax sp. Leaf267]KQP12479.1 exosortase [Pseudorhodoferax sp. Leaf267]
MNSHTLVRNPRFVRWGIAIDRLPSWSWMALQALALLPAWAWMARRLADGSDDPLGLLALAGLALLVGVHRRSLRASPALAWLGAALLLTLAATVARGPIAPLLASLLAVLALAAGLLAFLPRQVAATPVLGLAVLALPLLSSLQFYAGYPLRVLTAEASRWLLAPAFEVWRQGSTLLVDGRLVIVDAPCSGVQMVWLGYFTACAVALWARHADRTVLARLPGVGLAVLAGNIVRNSLLVAAEGAGRPLPAWGHEALGLAVLAAVCGAIAWWMARPVRSSCTFTPGARHAHAA